ncbi:ISAs1 family transposase, partial [Stenoxybacter acetivorans]|uniref:ISAs1 family transposase n=6 Tax=Stenoxybacter acetivorans TaxID=422441 RepID=UPI0012EB350A
MDLLVKIKDPRGKHKIAYSLPAILTIAICASLAGADTFVEMEQWAKEKIEWFQKLIPSLPCIPSHDTFGRVFSLIDPDEFEQAFYRWVRGVLPIFADNEIIAIDGKTSRRSGKADKKPLHLVSAFAAQANLVLGQQATAEKSNEKTAIPELLSRLA